MIKTSKAVNPFNNPMSLVCRLLHFMSMIQPPLLQQLRSPSRGSEARPVCRSVVGVVSDVSQP